LEYWSGGVMDSSRCQVSGVRMDGGVRRDAVTTKSYLDVEDLEVYRMLCQLHIEVCDLTHHWLSEEKYELGSQVRLSLFYPKSFFQ
jgi:hypothetical protein